VASLAFEAPFLGIEKIVLGGKTTFLAGLLNNNSVGWVLTDAIKTDGPLVRLVD
jgi:hypothetical protein